MIDPEVLGSFYLEQALTSHSIISGTTTINSALVQRDDPLRTSVINNNKINDDDDDDFFSFSTSNGAFQ